MNDEEQHTEASGLSEAEEEHVRALLAEARHAEPMPDDVVARLDRVIAGDALDELVEALIAENQAALLAEMEGIS